MECILNLFARMIPSTNGTSSGRAERSAFIRAVFVQSSPDDAKTAQELVKLLENVSNADWDQTAVKIVDLLSVSNIAFPQPFAIKEIIACGQHKPSDRLFVDDKCFLANVPVEDDLYESLSVAYSSLTKVEIIYRNTQSKAEDSSTDPKVVVSLSEPPVIGKELVYPDSNNGKVLDPIVVFTLDRDDVPRFHEAMKSRGLDQYVKINGSLKLSVAESPANLEVDSAGKLIEKEELEHRIDNLSQLYGTNEPSDDTPFCVQDNADADITLVNNAPVLDDLSSPNKTPVKALQSAVSKAESVSASPAPGVVSAGFNRSDNALGNKEQTRPETATPLHRTQSQLLRAAVFGASDDELSEVEDLPEPPTKPRKKKSGDLASFKASLVTNANDLFQSDSDVMLSSPTRGPKCRAIATSRKSIVISDDDEIEDVLPPSKINDSSISRRRSVLHMNPLKSSKASVAAQSKTASSALPNPAPASKKASTRVLATSLSSPKKVASVETVQYELENAPCQSSLQLDPIRTPGVLTTRGPSFKTPVADVSNYPHEAIDTPRKPQEHEPILQSSSPIPVAKRGRHTLKSSLRKKSGVLPQPEKPPAPAKRKRESENYLQDEDIVESQAKRAKSVDDTGIQPEITQSQVLRPRNTAAARASKRYHAKRKDKTSSPPAHTDRIDYDKIPNTPPSSVLDTKVKPEPALSRRTKQEVEPAKPEPPTTKMRTRGAATASKAKKSAGKTPETVAVQDHEESESVSRRSRRTERSKPKRHKVEPSDMDTAQEDIQTDAKAQILHVDFTANEDTFVEQEGLNDVVATSVVPRKSEARSKNKKAPWEDLQAVEHLLKIAEPILEAAIDPLRETDQISELRPSDDHDDVLLPSKSSKVTHYKLGERRTEDIVAMTGAETLIKEIPAEIVVPTAGASPIKQTRTIQRRVVVRSPTLDTEAVNYMNMDDQDRRDERATRAIYDKLATPFAREDDIYTSTPSRRLEKSLIGKVKLHAQSPRDLTKNSEAREANTGKAQQRKRQTPGIDELADVLQELQEAILSKVTGRIEGVRHSVRAGRERLLAEAAADLAEMHAESVDRYNQLIDLEADYATFGRKLIHGFEDLIKTQEGLNTTIRKNLETHDRGTLSKKMPTSIFKTQLPASIMKFKH
ncbi:hypothetical protein EIP86_007951 [Pleurotus ostreatoroseus]|nr:hypothetical protein EIP86_007951 [Pleurotus ostreatoroseus]